MLSEQELKQEKERKQKCWLDAETKEGGAESAREIDNLSHEEAVAKLLQLLQSSSSSSSSSSPAQDNP